MNHIPNILLNGSKINEFYNKLLIYINELNNKNDNKLDLMIHLNKSFGHGIGLE